VDTTSTPVDAGHVGLIVQTVSNGTTRRIEMIDVAVQIVYDIEKDSFEVTGNAKDPKDLVSEFIRSQMGQGRDESPSKNLDVYTIIIGLDLSCDSFSCAHDCGNKGLREGILQRFISR